VAFSPDGSTLAAGHLTSVKVWDMETGALRYSLEHSGHVNSVAFSSEGNILVSGGGALAISPNGTTIASVGDGTVSIWDAQTGRNRRTLKGQNAGSLSDSTVVLWDVETGEERLRIEDSPDTVEDVTFSPDGRMLATGNLLVVRLWDTSTGLLIYQLDGHEGEVVSLAFSPDGRRLASASYDRTIRLWNTASGEHQATIVRDRYVITSVAYAPDGY